MLQGEPDEHFCVVIRVRPPLERELVSPVWQHVVSISSETHMCLHEVIPEANAGDRASGTAQVVTNHFFAFDRVYSQDSSQPEVYESTARASVMSTLQGYNATILAYGPTGTGKTYTMEGCRAVAGDGRGIIPRSMEEIFQHIRHCRGPQSRFLVRASYLQIYNEVISDLLKPERTQLVVREDRRRGVFVEGLSEWLCRSPAEVQTLMEHGSAARATAQTAANDASSRSHAVFIVVLEQSEELAAEGPARSAESERAAGPEARRRVRVGRLNLVDLAGSERPRLTGATGQRLEETKKINQSLSALGNVISALTERRPRQHVPYRDSKLTRLLEDSLGGNCRTTMMAMVSPAAEAFAESLSTLKFAHRAKAIRNSPQVNEDVDQRTLLRRYEAELRRLRSELRERGQGDVIGRRQLLELEEGRRRAEEDRQAAVSALEERGVILEQEKAQKQQLEVRIRQMSSQLLVGGGQQAEDALHFQHAVAEQERIRSEYAAKLLELERERSTIEEDKAQVGRYKQLLLKQRDIMIALTQRLHERDETIIGLQDELDARDRRIAELEEEHLVGPAWRADDLVSGAGDTPMCAGLDSLHYAPVEMRYPPEHPVLGPCIDQPMQLLTADEKIAELTAMLSGQRQENRQLALEIEGLKEQQDTMALQHFSTPGPGIGVSESALGHIAPAAVIPGTASMPEARRVCSPSADGPIGGQATAVGSRLAANPVGDALGTLPGRERAGSDCAVGPSAIAASPGPRGRYGSSPKARGREASATPTTDGASRASTPRPELRSRRPASQERGCPSAQLRSSSLHLEKPLTLRRGGGRGSYLRACSHSSVASSTASPKPSSLGPAQVSSAGASSSNSSRSGSSGTSALSGHGCRRNAGGGAELGTSARPGYTAGSRTLGEQQHAGRPTQAPQEEERDAAATVRDAGSLGIGSGIGLKPGSGVAGLNAGLAGGNLAGFLANSGVTTSYGRGGVAPPGPHGLRRSASAGWPVVGSGPVRAAPLPGSGKPSAAAVAAADAVAATSLSGSGAGTPTAETLREEAERAVDALLARRKAELRRAAAAAAAPVGRP